MMGFNLDGVFADALLLFLFVGCATGSRVIVAVVVAFLFSVGILSCCVMFQVDVAPALARQKLGLSSVF